MAIFRILLPLIILVLSGCASTKYRNPQDPLEPLNRSIYKFNDTMDTIVLRPMAQGYKAVVPPTGRSMVHNFFSNLDDVIVTLNDLLQFKLKQAFSDTGRLVINTSVGAFGLVDAASAVGYPKHDEDFGQTLGYWGVDNGPYLVIPFLGPSTLRDSIGDLVDSQASQITNIKHMRTRNQVILVKAVSRRAELLGEEGMLEGAALDQYSFIRDAYLSHRRSLVYDGNPPRIKYDDYEDDAAPGPSSANDVRPVPAAHTATPSVSEADANPEPVVYRVWLARH
jgi:phospholipid-binding lipoprotein MlaA